MDARRHRRSKAHKSVVLCTTRDKRMDTLDTQITPNMLYAAPSLWLCVPHAQHPALRTQVRTQYPGWNERSRHVVCFECIGAGPVRMEDEYGREFTAIGAVYGSDDNVVRWATPQGVRCVQSTQSAQGIIQ